MSPLTFLISGLVLGFSAAISPGPMTMLTISQTIRYGLREGVKVAFTPIFTDGPIILIALLVLSRFRHSQIVVGIISLFGAGFLIYLAWENFQTLQFNISESQTKPNSFKKGFITDILNPHPYLFYFTVGGTFILRGLQVNFLSALLFILGVTFAAVAEKILIAVLAHQSRYFFRTGWYKFTVRMLGVVLLIFAGQFLYEAVKLFRFF